MIPRVRTTLNLHVEPGVEIEAHERDCHRWVTLGHVGMFFDDDADVSRLIRELEVLRHRMRERAHLPEIESFDPVAESLDREQVEVGSR